MRLTLRTLLAYLDDTLEPSEIKPIGQKVAESDAAQELIARIKQITRRRRITTPSLTGPGAKFDANTVAEYLDNQLPSDQVSELEKTCLESDVHLAEIAACHQILTLVLGEPALVPPTAKERMYQLVLGREAIPYRKAPHPSSTSSLSGSQHELEPDESPLLGLPFFRKPGWVGWVLPLAAVLLVAALGVAIWMALPEKEKSPQYAAGDPNRRKAGKDVERDDKGKDAEKDGKGKEQPEPVKDPKKDPMADPTKDPKKDPMKDPMTEPVKDPDYVPTIGRKPPPAPRLDHLVAGTVQEPDKIPSILVHRQRPAGDAPFKRLLPEGAVYTNETLVSLPGTTTQIETKKGVGLTLRGNLPEFSVNPLMDFLLESEVVLHAPPDKIDLDLTLDRGRIYLTNLKEGQDAVVRLRFVDQVWDLTLRGETVLGVDLIKKYPGDMNYFKEEPLSNVALFVIQGDVDLTLKNNFKKKLKAPPGPALIQWDSVTDDVPNPVQIPDEPLIWSKQPPWVVLNKHVKSLEDRLQKSKEDEARVLKFEHDYYAAQAGRAKVIRSVLEELSGMADLTDGKRPIDQVFYEELLRKDKPENRHVAIFALGAIGDVEKLLAVLTDEDPDHAAERDEAVFVLRRYMSRSLKASRLLYKDDGKNKSGLLVEKYGEKDGERVFELLHDFDPKNITSDTFRYLTAYLKSDKLAVRLLAIWHLSRLSVGVKLPPQAAMYNPADPSKQRRDDAASQWQELVEKGDLPPKRQ